MLASGLMNSMIADVLAHTAPRPRSRRRILQKVTQAPRVIHCVGLAAWSFLRCLPMMAASRPRTPLRVLCITAFEYLSRLEGRGQQPATRAALALACDFGALCNDFYDQQELNLSEYKRLRMALRRLVPESAIRGYMRNLRHEERGRPSFPPDEVFETRAVEYRNRVLVLSMDWLYKIAGVTPSPAFFRTLVALTGLIQLVDDLLDWEDDWRCRRPSYVTGLLKGPSKSFPGATARIQSRANHFRDLLVATSEEHPEAAPLAFAGIVVWLLVVGLTRLRFVA